MRDNGIVSIVEDDPDVCELLRHILEQHGLSCEFFERANDFLGNYDPRIPGCLILDLRLPDGDGIELLREARRRGWHVPTIVLTAFGAASSAVSAMKLGTLDYLEKPFQTATLVAKVTEAVAIDKSERQKADDLAAAIHRFAGLTPREQELLNLLIAGGSNKAIARDLGIALKTVKNHRAHLMEKVRATNTADLVRLANAAGLGGGMPGGAGATGK